MKTSAGFHQTIPLQEKISERAQELWEGYGRPADRDTEIWLEAERQLLSAALHYSAKSSAHLSGDPTTPSSGLMASASKAVLVGKPGDTSVSSAPRFDETTRKKKPAPRLTVPKVKAPAKPQSKSTAPAPARPTPKPRSSPAAAGRKTVKSMAEATAPVAKRTGIEKPTLKKPAAKTTPAKTPLAKKPAVKKR